MKFFNEIVGGNFRWIGFYVFKTTFALGFSFGKPIWWFPRFIFTINNPDHNDWSYTRTYFDVGGGWICFSCRIQAIGVKSGTTIPRMRKDGSG